MTHSPDERGLELRELFFETSQELLQALNDEALKLEKKPGDEEIVRVIRRTVHTLKGDSAACGLRELSELAHQFEDALSLEGTATQAAVAEIAFAAADVFAEMIAAYRKAASCRRPKALSKKIQDLTRRTGSRAKPAEQDEQAAGKTCRHSRRTSDTVDRVRKAGHDQGAGAGWPCYHVVVKIDPHCAMPIAGRQLIHNA